MNACNNVSNQPSMNEALLNTLLASLVKFIENKSKLEVLVKFVELAGLNTAINLAQHNTSSIKWLNDTLPEDIDFSIMLVNLQKLENVDLQQAFVRKAKVYLTMEVEINTLNNLLIQAIQTGKTPEDLRAVFEELSSAEFDKEVSSTQRP